MERSNEYASKGQGNTAVTLGAVALGAALLNGGLGNGCGNGILGLGGNNNNCYATKDELRTSEVLAQKDAEIAFYKSGNNTDQKIIEVTAFFNNKLDNVNQALAQNAISAAENRVRFECLESQVSKNTAVIEYHGRELCAQGAYNAANNEKIGCIQATLDGLTKTVIPANNVCDNPVQVQLLAQMAALTEVVASKK